MLVLETPAARRTALVVENKKISAAYDADLRMQRQLGSRNQWRGKRFL
jgi:hypothetical protein